MSKIYSVVSNRPGKQLKLIARLQRRRPGRRDAAAVATSDVRIFAPSVQGTDAVIVQ